MKIHKLTLVILGVTALVDEGTHNNISIDEIHKVISSKSLIKYLSEEFEEKIDLSFLDEKDINEYEEMISNIYDAHAGNESRKWGIKNNGLCLVIAWTNEVIQQNATLN